MEYKVYHDTFSSVIQEAEKYAESNGYEIVGQGVETYTGGVSYGQTKRLYWDLIKNGKTNELNIQIYRMDSGKYELNMYFSKSKYSEGGKTNDRDIEIANTILSQLGGANRLKVMTGANNFIAHKNGVSFRIKNPKANYISITLNEMDTYDVEIGRVRGDSFKVIKEGKGIYFDMLKKFIESGTGMYLSLFKKGGSTDSVNLKMFKDGNKISYKGDYKDITFKGEMEFEFAKRDKFSSIESEFEAKGIEISKSDIYKIREKLIDSLSRYDVNFRSGGSITYVDLFEYPNRIPVSILEIFDKYGDGLSYQQLSDMQKEVENKGYTFDYYLDAEPFGLRKKGVRLNQLKGYEDVSDESYSYGGSVKKQEIYESAKMLADNSNWTNDMLKKEYERYKFNLSEFNAGILKPSKVIGGGYKSSAFAKKLAKEWLEDNIEKYKLALEIRGEQYAKGGSVHDDKKEMVLGKTFEVEHHAKELRDGIKKASSVDAWVVAKVQRASTDLSDVAHYIDNTNRKFDIGGSVKRYEDLSKMKPEVVNESDTVKIPEIEILKKEVRDYRVKDLKVTSSRDAYEIFYDFWDKQRINLVEHFNVLLLKNNNKPIAIYQHSKGGITGTVADVQVITAIAVKSLAKGVIIAHNHPSGNLTPSEADKRLSKQIYEALKIFDIKLLDSLIIVPKDGESDSENVFMSKNYISLSEEGII